MKMLSAIRSIVGLRLPQLSMVVAAAMVATPAQAATFADSRVQSSLSNFRVNGYEALPFVTDSVSDTDATVIGGLSSVVALSDADAFFQEQPPFAGAFATGSSNGLGTLPYFGQTTASADAVGSFTVNGLFEFDFSSLLDLETGIEDADSERALAAGDIQLSLFRETETGSELIDYFSLSGLVASNTNEDIFGADYSDNFNLSLFPADCGQPGLACINNSFGGNQEFAYASLSGHYQREFQGPTILTVVKSQLSLTEVEEVPEASSVLALGLLGLGALGLRRARTDAGGAC